jgi:hypothetical protein
MFGGSQSQRAGFFARDSMNLWMGLPIQSDNLGNGIGADPAPDANEELRCHRLAASAGRCVDHRAGRAGAREGRAGIIDKHAP